MRSPPPSTLSLQPSTSFWLALETVPGGTALPTIWKRHLDRDFTAFKSLFLKARPDTPAQFVPCPWNCGCLHKVVRADNGTLQGLCQCDTRACGPYTVMPDELIPLELDWSRLAQVLCRAFALQPATVRFGLYNTLQFGTWSTVALPVILTLCSSKPEFLNNVTGLAHRLGQPFILLAPTSRHLGPAAKEFLAHTGSAFFALQDHLQVTTRSTSSPLSRLDIKNRVAAAPGVPSPTQFELMCSSPPAKLFAQVAPVQALPSDEALARRTFIVLQEQDQSRRRRRPTLYTVFQLYCVKELTIPQIASKCHCSIGTVANRLKLLQAKTGAASADLRRVAPHFVHFEDDCRQAQRNYHHRKSSSLVAP